MAQCVATTDCASLGYTESSCPNGGLKCPFGTTWSCKENYGSKNDDINCTYGSIYYNDGVCVKEFVSGSIPIGIVVYVDLISKEKWVISLDIPGWREWGEKGTDIPEITNYTSEITVISDLKSCENTAAMISKGNSSAYPAAWVAHEYAPAGAEETKGKWCLPAIGIFNMIREHKTLINESLTKVSGKVFDTNMANADRDHFYWSSSEKSADEAWYWGSQYDENVNALRFSDKKGGSSYCNIRPVMKIP